MALDERRSSYRFRMRLPLDIHWANGSGVAEAFTESRDVSSRGMAFSLPNEIQVGSLVEIVMTLPHEVTFAGPIKVRCLGRILRAKREGTDTFALAAAVERYEFIRNHD